MWQRSWAQEGEEFKLLAGNQTTQLTILVLFTITCGVYTNISLK